LKLRKGFFCAKVMASWPQLHTAIEPGVVQVTKRQMTRGPLKECSSTTMNTVARAKHITSRSPKARKLNQEKSHLSTSTLYIKICDIQKIRASHIPPCPDNSPGWVAGERHRRQRKEDNKKSENLQGMVFPPSPSTPPKKLKSSPPGCMPKVAKIACSMP
jgi:arsenate reductase-like glutaredoxin family protein